MLRSLRDSLRRLARTALRGPPPRLRARPRVSELEGREVPATFYVTNGGDSGSGSLRQAYADAVNAGNQNTIVIDDSVDTITLDSPLIEGPTGLTVLEIVTENDEQVEIETSDPGEFRFIDHDTDNGVVFDFENLYFDGWGVDSGDGGVIRTVAVMYLDSCVFNFCFAGGDGGAIYATYSLDLTNCDFTECVAGGDGGAVYCAPTETAAGLTITDCLFFTNSAEGNGGAVYYATVAGTLRIYDATRFGYNVAGGRGGAVYMYGGFGGTIEAITEGFGFEFNTDGDTLTTGEFASDLFLLELANAHIETDTSDGNSPNGDSIYLYSTTPPALPDYWCYIDDTRIGGDIESNWPV